MLSLFDLPHSSFLFNSIILPIYISISECLCLIFFFSSTNLLYFYKLYKDYIELCILFYVNEQVCVPKFIKLVSALFRFINCDYVLTAFYSKKFFGFDIRAVN